MSECKHHINQFHDDCNVCGASVSDIISTLQARNEALEKAAADVVECGVYGMAYDRRQVLDALAALLQEPTK